MQKITVELEDSDYQRLKSSKVLYDYIMDEDTEFTDWNTYIATLLWRAIKAMIEDVTPADNPLLQQTLIKMHKENPEFVSNFIVKVIEAGGKEEAKRKLGFIKDRVFKEGLLE